MSWHTAVGVCMSTTVIVNVQITALPRSICGCVFHRVYARGKIEPEASPLVARHHYARTIVRSRRDRVRYHCIAFIYIRAYRYIGRAGDHRICIVYDRYRHVAGRRVAACIRGRYRDRRLTVEGYACCRALRHCGARSCLLRR